MLSPRFFLSAVFILQNARAYNLVIDTQPQGVEKFVHSFREFFEEKLNNSDIPVIEKKRCLGSINLSKITLSQVEVERVVPVLQGGDYYIKIQHLHGKLHGDYHHNVLFVHQEGDFELRLRDVNATIGPLIPVAIAGLPYIDNSLGCAISHSEDKIDVTGGIMRAIAKTRLRDTMGSDLEGILCDSLVDVLDSVIRRSISHLELSRTIHGDTSINYFLSHQPTLLPSKAIRTYHAGITNGDQSFRFQADENDSTSHDVVFHVHQNLLGNALNGLCNDRQLDVVMQSGSEQALCQKVSVSMEHLIDTQTANVVFTFDLNGTIEERNYVVSIMYSEHLVISLRVKSEIVQQQQSQLFDREFFASVSSRLRSVFSLPLPIPIGSKIDRANVKLQSDRIVLFANIVF